MREASLGRVLVVEDDESTALFVTRVLSRNGFDAAWVMDAEQASERLENEPFDVLLADCRLPGRSGLELAQEARRSRPCIGIAVMTSFNEGGTADSARASGADDFFEKPLHSSNLVTRIRDLVMRSRAFPEGPSTSSSQRDAHGAPPRASVPEVAPRSDAPGPPNVAESGSSERAVPRDTAPAPQDAEAAEGAARPRLEGVDGIRRTRSSAVSEEEGSPNSGCEVRQDVFPREEAGHLDRDLLARVAHPAFSRLIAQSIAAELAMDRVLIWAYGAPAVSIGSRAGRVMAPSTRPG
jgi:CheY-like chemotaxis protein